MTGGAKMTKGCGLCHARGHYAKDCPHAEVFARAKLDEARSALMAAIVETETAYHEALDRLHKDQQEMIAHRRKLEGLFAQLKKEVLGG